MPGIEEVDRYRTAITIGWHARLGTYPTVNLGSDPSNKLRVKGHGAGAVSGEHVMIRDFGPGVTYDTSCSPSSSRQNANSSETPSRTGNHHLFVWYHAASVFQV